MEDIKEIIMNANKLIKSSIKKNDLKNYSQSQGYIDIKKLVDVTKKYSELKSLGLLSDQ